MDHLQGYFVNNEKQRLRIKSFEPELVFNWQEFIIYSRLMYKSKNQHKKTFYYKKLQLVKRVFQRLRLINIQQILPKETTSIGCEYQIGLEFAMDRLMEIHGLLKFAIESIQRAYMECRARASQTFFMALNLSFMASLSKLSKQSSDLLETIEKCFNEFHDKYSIMGGVKHYSLEEYLVIETVPHSLGEESKADMKHVKTHKWETSIQMQTIRSLSDDFFESKESNVSALDPTAKSMKTIAKEKKLKKKETFTDDIDDLFAQYL
jgi:hypothetical protein